MSLGPTFRTAAVGAALAAVSLIIFAPASYARSTDYQNVATPGWAWDTVTNDGLSVADLEAYFPDFQGTGAALYGWTSDAFDGLMDSRGSFSYPGYSSVLLNMNPVTANYVDDGLSTIVGSQDLDFGDGITFTATSTMEIQGSYVRWALAFESTGAGDADVVSYALQGYLGSDGATTWVAGAAGEYASYQDPAARYTLDPVLGWKITPSNTATIQVSDGNDSPRFVGSGNFALTVVAAEWDVCSFDVALAGVTGALATLDASFGGTLGEYYTANCWALASPAPAAVGSALDYTVALDNMPAQFATVSGYDDDDYLDYLGLIVKSAPAGITVTLEEGGEGEKSLRVVGTMPAAVSTIEVVLYSTYNYDEGAWPFVSTMTLTPTASETAEETDAAELAATGSTEETPWVGVGAAALLLAGTGLLVWRRRA